MTLPPASWQPTKPNETRQADYKVSIRSCGSSLRWRDRSAPGRVISQWEDLGSAETVCLGRAEVAAERLVALYEALNKPDRAAEFRAPAAAEQDNSPISKTPN